MSTIHFVHPAPRDEDDLLRICVQILYTDVANPETQLRRVLVDHLLIASREGVTGLAPHTCTASAAGQVLILIPVT